MADSPDIFLSYASEDREKALSLFGTLMHCGFEVWIDKKYVGPGYDWKYEIEKVIRESRIFLICLSNNSVNKRGLYKQN